jgi:DNA-binding PadR family transcriptional regulator
MPPRFLRHGELPLVVLALLEREPMHGYQVLGELTRVFAGAYEPSAGSVYPAIRALRQDGLVGASADGRRSVYSLTDRGHQTLRARGEQLAALEVRTGARLRVATSVDGVIDRFTTRARLLAPRLDARVTEQLLSEAAARLEALARTPGSS